MSSVDATTMLQASAGLLGVAALGGLGMAGIRFAGKRNPPAWLGLLHGLLVAAALGLLVFAACVLVVPKSALWALGFFLAAALGGAVMNLGYAWKNQLIPGTLLVGHAVLAVSGFALLVLAAFVD